MLSGYSGIDELEYGIRSRRNVWRNSNEDLKKAIWAPHHTIEEKGDLVYSNFLRYHQVMLNVAEHFRDRVQFAFKPHPLLKIKLYGHTDWGQTRTDNYFRHWETLANGQLETDDYIDLFNTSDAMIFDSNSFVLEYLCCGKPSLFTLLTPDVKEKFNEFGKMALDVHYHGYDEAQIVDFIQTVVCGGEDSLSEERYKFYNRHMKPPNNQTTSENIYHEVCDAIWGNDQRKYAGSCSTRGVEQIVGKA